MRRVVPIVAILAAAGIARAETLDVVRTLPHSGWSEGLEIHDGVIWAPYGHSIRVLDLEDGSSLASYPPPSGYEESLTWFRGKLWALSWTTNDIYEGTLSADGASISWIVAGKTPDVHGWGFTHDDHFLILSGNGEPFLYFIDPDTMTLVRTVTTPIDDLEDLAWDGRWVWASSYSIFPGTEMRIDPETGEVVDLYALPEPSECMKLDGVEVFGDLLYVTGKDCPFIYVATLPPL